ncbi:MAG: hypothetical protein JHC61_11380 [Burkholderiaceae bacterium]|nr:hypothetical protein [Burkholderiaceae bacterium]
MSATMRRDDAAWWRVVRAACATLAALAAGISSARAVEGAVDAADAAAPLALSERFETEATLVRDWLEMEARHARRSMKPLQGEPATPVAPSVELVAIYGIGRDLGAELRIGGARHVLIPSSGAGRATDGKGADSLIAEHIAGSCLTLRYRRTVRRLCLPAMAEPMAKQSSKAKPIATGKGQDNG